VFITGKGYLPFGLQRVLITAAFLTFLGIYNLAILVSTNNSLHRSIYKHTLVVVLVQGQ